MSGDNKRQGSGGIKPSYDSRRPFSEELVKMISSITESSATQQMGKWELYLRNYYTLTYHYIGLEDRQQIETGFRKIERSNYCMTHRKNPHSTMGGIGFDTPTVAMLLVQRIMFSATAHLLLPAGDIDDGDNLDLGSVV